MYSGVMNLCLAGQRDDAKLLLSNSQTLPSDAAEMERASLICRPAVSLTPRASAHV